MTKWIVILFSMFVTRLGAQSRELFIVIDTIDFKAEQADKLNLSVGNQGFLNLGEDFDSTQILTINTFPNYFNKIRLNHDSATINLPVDKHGSHITLENFHKLKSDTLRISKLTIFDIKVADSIYTKTYYYKIRNGQLIDKAYRVKFEKSGSSFSMHPLTVNLLINGIKYETKLEATKEEGEVMHGHGYSKKNPYNKNGNYKKRLTKFYIDQRKYECLWTGKIVLIE